MAKTLSLRELFEAYPGSDLLGCGPPAQDEGPLDYKARVEHEGGDTLYLFLVRELADADQLVDIDTAGARVRRAMLDLQEVHEAIEGKREVSTTRTRLVEMDGIADQAADRYGIDCLLPVSEEGEASDAEDELEPQVRLDRLVAKLNLKDGDLDSLVRDVATEIASDINSAGVSRQLKYLVDELGIENAVESLQLLIRKEGGPT